MISTDKLIDILKKRLGKPTKKNWILIFCGILFIIFDTFSIKSNPDASAVGSLLFAWGYIPIYCNFLLNKPRMLLPEVIIPYGVIFFYVMLVILTFQVFIELITEK